MIERRAIGWLMVASSALLLGCPTLGDTLPVVPLGDAQPDAGSGDAQPDSAAPGRDVLDAMRDAPPDARPPPLDRAPPMDSAPPPEMAPPDSGCRPGTPLGPCSVCGEQGEPVAPDDDPLCPQLECDGLSRYTLSDRDGALVCDAEHRFAVTGRCRALGVCHEDVEIYCSGRTEVTEAEVVPSACLDLVGCQGAVPPEVVQDPEGSRCNDVGACNARGLCTANPVCDDFALPGQSFFCAARDGDRTYCQFYLQPGMPIDCATFCGLNGWRCGTAWNSMVGMCAHEPLAVDCAVAFESFVCRCVP